MLGQRGFDFVREDAIFSKIPNRAKRPDFYVMPPGGSNFLVEVESFKKPTPLDLIEADAMFVADTTPQKRIDRRVRAAADQLAPYADLDIPLVVLLDNHRQVRLEGLGLEALAALFGDLMNDAWNPDAPLVRGARDYISAVLVNEPCVWFDDDQKEEPFTLPRPMRVRVIHHPHAARPLSLATFAVGENEQFVRTTRWMRVR
jgi:hypothetical protein